MTRFGAKELEHSLQTVNLWSTVVPWDDMLEEIGVRDTEFDGVIHVADRCDVYWDLKFADHF